MRLGTVPFLLSWRTIIQVVTQRLPKRMFCRLDGLLKRVFVSEFLLMTTLLSLKMVGLRYENLVLSISNAPEPDVL